MSVQLGLSVFYFAGSCSEIHGPRSPFYILSASRDLSLSLSLFLPLKTRARGTRRKGRREREGERGRLEVRILFFIRSARCACAIRLDAYRGAIKSRARVRFSSFCARPLLSLGLNGKIFVYHLCEVDEKRFACVCVRYRVWLLVWR